MNKQEYVIQEVNNLIVSLQTHIPTSPLLNVEELNEVLVMYLQDPENELLEEMLSDEMEYSESLLSTEQ